MIKLSKRLQMNANLVPSDCILADIGCDHGYVSIYLIKNNICKRVFALDVNEGPLLMARKNIKKYGLEDKIECRLSDGLSNVKKGEINACLIGGMGGMLVSSILKNGKSTLEGVDTIIVQPQSDYHIVRKTIFELGFGIENECFCIDSNKPYISILASKKSNDNDYDDAQMYFGKNRQQEYLDYLTKEKSKRKSIVENLSKNPNEAAIERVNELQYEIGLLDKILE